MNVRILRRTFALLEWPVPQVGGALAARLWFQLPPRPTAARRHGRTPPGGEPFEIDLDHGRIRGRVFGDWGRPTVYLVHGWGGWWQQLGALVQPLVDEGLCVVAFDAPSHGDSEPGRDGARSTTFPEMAEALAAVEREFGHPTIVIAHSGGALATMLALDHPGVPLPEALAFVAVPTTVEAMVSVFAAALRIGPRSRTAMRPRVERRAGARLADFDLLTLAASRPRLPRLLLVHDADDPEAPLAGAIDTSNAWHDSRLLVTHGLGHRRPLWEESVVKQVVEFAAAAADRVRSRSAAPAKGLEPVRRSGR